tara:strand:- start:220 stop:711 length:492 start_codon:yes stop_codon:yes gene_type:complete
MPKVYDQEIKLSAMKLWIEGLSGPKIVAKLHEEFATEVKLPTLYVWAKQLKWNEQKDLAHTAAMEHIQESEGQRFARVQTEHLTEYEGMRHKAGAALGVLQFDRAYDAAKVLDMGIQGERKVMEGMINLQFVQSVLNILVEEVSDQDTIQRIAGKLKSLVAQE